MPGCAGCPLRGTPRPTRSPRPTDGWVPGSAAPGPRLICLSKLLIPAQSPDTWRRVKISRATKPEVGSHGTHNRIQPPLERGLEHTASWLFPFPPPLGICLTNTLGKEGWGCQRRRHTSRAAPAPRNGLAGKRRCLQVNTAQLRRALNP